MQARYLLLLALISISAALLTWAALHYAHWRQLMDLPGARRSHQVSTPRGGGIAIVVSQLLACAVAVIVFPAAAASLLAFALGLLLVAGIGWWDDHRPLPALPRLCIHLLAALLLAGLVWAATGSLLKAVFCAGLTVSLINIWNFMDGINGLATTQAILVGIGAGLLLPAPLSLAGWLLAAGCLGFLPFNFPRPRIFMGDVGSGALGYLVAAIIALGLCTTEVAPGLWLVLPAAFLVDAGFTLLLRMINGEAWLQAHTQHLYQRFVKRGAAHSVVTLGYGIFSVFGLTIALLFSKLPLVWGWTASVLWLLAGTVLWISLRSRLSS